MGFALAVMAIWQVCTAGRSSIVYSPEPDLTPGSTPAVAGFSKRDSS